MKFNSVKEMEAGLMKVTSLEQLKEDMTFTSLGNVITVKVLGVGSSMGQQEVAYGGYETADQMKVQFSGTGDAITVSKVKVSLH